MPSSSSLSKLFLGISFALACSAAAVAETTPPATDPAGTTTSAPATTTNPATADASTTPTTPAKDPDEEIVCRKEEATTGSRLGARKVCHTVREWRLIQARAKEITESIQREGGNVNPEGR